MILHTRLGRAKEKLASEKPSTNVNFRLYIDEKEALEIAAKNADLSVSAYVRECVFNTLSLPEVSKEKRPDAQDSAKKNGAGLENESFSRPDLGNAARIARIAENCSESLAPIESFDSQVEKRTGHKRGCECFACGRLREMILAPKRKRGRPRKTPE